MPRDARANAARAKALAYAAGFDLAGIATLGAVESAPHLARWLAAGYHGEMAYLERGRALREDTTRPEAGMRSAIVVGRDYGGKQPSGAVARYARGADYHDAMRAQLRELHTSLEHELGGAIAARPYVDTGPILERDLARRAGLGWFGKNTMLIHPKRGSFFFIGALFTALDLTPDEPFTTDHCGTCTRCLDACPTDAFVEPHVMDATKCISYLTIEHRSAVPPTLRAQASGFVFGCDICQDVCPWNEKFASAPRGDALAPRADRTAPDLREWLAMDDAQFRARFRGSAIMRTKRRGLARNAAIALGNRGDASDVPALVASLCNDPEPLVRAHAAWALGQFDGSVPARDGLIAARDTERDSGVRSEIDTALRTLDLPGCNVPTS
jgi:epoxyqueuosine reductase